MIDRRRSRLSIVIAACGYAANCLLGTAVALRLVDTSRIRWVHHLLYIVTCATTAVALVVSAMRPESRRAAAALAPATVPLAVIPFAGTRRLRHPLVALAAAPFYLAGLLCSRSAADRK